jgi:inorganic pyrophosphatase
MAYVLLLLILLVLMELGELRHLDDRHIVANLALDVMAVSNKKEGTKDLRLEFVQKISPWHDIEYKTDDAHYINAVVEIPKGTLDKFEVATKEDWNSIKPDIKDGKLRYLKYNGKCDEKEQFVFNGMPCAYGMIPRTFEDPSHTEKVKVNVIGEKDQEEVEVGGDEDPLDIYVLADRALPIGVVKCKVIGIYHYVDSGEIDYKVMAVDAEFKDIDKINEISDLENFDAFKNAPKELMNWLKWYKTVDNDGERVDKHEKKFGKEIGGRATNAAEALRVIEECRESYYSIVNDEKKQKSDDYKDLKWSSPRKAQE